MQVFHHVKSVRIRSFSDPYLPTFGLNNKRYYDTFSRNVCLQVTAHIDIKIGHFPNLCELPENVNMKVTSRLLFDMKLFLKCFLQY